MEFTFLYPKYLYGLFVIALVVLIHFLTLKNRRHVSVKFANFDSIANIKGVDFYSKNFSLLFCSIILVTLMVMSLSGLTVHYDSEVSEYSYVIALDVSESMLATDLSPTRLESAKAQIVSFVRNSPEGVKFGILSFSGNAYIEQEVTSDKSLIIDSVNKISVGQVSGTDIYEAVLTASNMLYNEDNKAVVLFSDGQINVGSIEDAISYAQQRGIVVHGLALGTTQGGASTYGISQVDYSSLQGLSYNTNGVFMNVTENRDLGEYFSEVLSLKFGKSSLLLTPYLIIATLAFFIIVYLLMNLHVRVLP